MFPDQCQQQQIDYVSKSVPQSASQSVPQSASQSVPQSASQSASRLQQNVLNSPDHFSYIASLLLDREHNQIDVNKANRILKRALLDVVSDNQDIITIQKLFRTLTNNNIYEYFTDCLETAMTILILGELDTVSRAGEGDCEAIGDRFTRLQIVMQTVRIAAMYCYEPGCLNDKRDNIPITLSTESIHHNQELIRQRIYDSVCFCLQNTRQFYEWFNTQYKYQGSSQQQILKDILSQLVINKKEIIDEFPSIIINNIKSCYTFGQLMMEQSEPQLQDKEEICDINGSSLPVYLIYRTGRPVVDINDQGMTAVYLLNTMLHEFGHYIQWFIIMCDDRIDNPLDNERPKHGVDFNYGLLIIKQFYRFYNAIHDDSKNKIVDIMCQMDLNLTEESRMYNYKSQFCQLNFTESLMERVSVDGLGDGCGRSSQRHIVKSIIKHKYVFK